MGEYFLLSYCNLKGANLEYITSGVPRIFERGGGIQPQSNMHCRKFFSSSKNRFSLKIYLGFVDFLSQKLNDL